MKKTMFAAAVVALIAVPTCADAGYGGGGFRGGGFRSTPSYRAAPSYKSTPSYKSKPAYKAAPKTKNPPVQPSKNEPIKKSTTVQAAPQQNTFTSNPFMWMFGWMWLTQSNNNEQEETK